MECHLEKYEGVTVKWTEFSPDIPEIEPTKIRCRQVLSNDPTPKDTNDDSR